MDAMKWEGPFKRTRSITHQTRLRYGRRTNDVPSPGKDLAEPSGIEDLERAASGALKPAAGVGEYAGVFIAQAG